MSNKFIKLSSLSLFCILNTIHWMNSANAMEEEKAASTHKTTQRPSERNLEKGWNIINDGLNDLKDNTHSMVIKDKIRGPVIMGVSAQTAMLHMVNGRYPYAEEIDLCNKKMCWAAMEETMNSVPNKNSNNRKK